MSLKCDIATRNNRSFLGVNVQFIADLQLQIRTLAIKVLEDRHTSENLRTVMKNFLKDYNFPLKGVYSCTTDNGSNMVKLVKILSEEQCNENISDHEAILDEDEIDASQENEVSDTENDDTDLEYNVLPESDDEATLLEGVIDNNENALLECVRCGAHSLQLCACDALKIHMTRVIPKVFISNVLSRFFHH